MLSSLEMNFALRTRAINDEKHFQISVLGKPSWLNQYFGIRNLQAH
jgi:hypothetical protein